MQVCLSHVHLVDLHQSHLLALSCLLAPRVACAQSIMYRDVLRCYAVWGADVTKGSGAMRAQWLQLGHVTSPMTNQPLPHPGLTPNRALKSAIMQWRGR